MSSPFHIFRKHQKAMFALLAIMCMIGFSVTGLVSMDTDRGRSSEDPIVATAYGQNIHASEVQQLLQQRMLAINFLAECWTAGSKMPPQFAEMFAQRIGAQMFGQPTEESVVEMWVLDERARRMGMVISDSAINKFLRDFTNDQLKSDAFNQILRQLRHSQAQLFDALRGELMAKRLRDISLAGAGQSTPAQRWDYYRRQKQRAAVELVPVHVEDFVGEVSDPPNEELQAFFDAHKEQEPDPLNPTPGFKQPKKAAFQVVVAEFEKFYDPTAVSDAEIKEHYEQFKDTRYLWEQYALTDEDYDAAAKPSPDEEKPSGQPPADGEKPESEKPGDETKPPEEKEADEKDAGKDDAGEKQSSLGPIRPPAAGWLATPAVAVAGLLAADDDAPAAEKETTQTTETPEKDDADTGEKPAAIVDGREKPAEDETQAEAKPATDNTTGKKKKPAVAPQITDELLLKRDIRQGSHPKHAPLWKVENDIRKELAREAANKKIEAALTVVREKMRKFARNLDDEEGEHKMADLGKVAKAQGLSEFDTGLFTEREFKDKYSTLADAFGDQRGRTFLQIAYGPTPKFQQVTVQDVEGNHYLTWKVEEIEAHVPDFADVRSKVLREWKMVQARDLAAAKARQLAEEANKAAKPLKELFADRQGLTVLEPTAFSWLTRGTANVDNRSPLTISEVEGVEAPGQDFMREVFRLGVGTAGEAMNEPRTVAYVIRVISIEPSREVLRAGFFADPYQLYSEVAIDDQIEVREAWFKGIEAEAHLTWKDPDRRRRE